MSKVDGELDWLSKAYEEPLTQNPPTTTFNTRLRRCLRQYASAARLKYEQDSAGNIYITRAGREPELSGIAVCFPIDEGLSPSTFRSAFRVFRSLAGEDLVCDLVLLGWTTTQGKILGQQTWQSAVNLNEWQIFAGQKAATASKIVSGSDQFEGLPHPSDFPLSAIFEVEIMKSERLYISGSTVLVGKAQKYSAEDVQIGQCLVKASRAPELRIAGAEAEDVALATIRDYSNYIAALFDNFD